VYVTANEYTVLEEKKEVFVKYSQVTFECLCDTCNNKRRRGEQESECRKRRDSPVQEEAGGRVIGRSLWKKKGRGCRQRRGT
jgi:hypothetical protein